MKELNEVYALIQKARNNNKRRIELVVSKHDKDRYNYVFREFKSVGYRTNFSLNEFNDVNQLEVFMEW